MGKPGEKYYKGRLVPRHSSGSPAAIRTREFRTEAAPPVAYQHPSSDDR
jgi:hypothetical protein